MNIKEHPMVGSRHFVGEHYERGKFALTYNVYPVPEARRSIFYRQLIPTQNSKFEIAVKEGIETIAHVDFLLVEERLVIGNNSFANLFAWVPDGKNFNPLFCPSCFQDAFGKVCMGTSGDFLDKHAAPDVFFNSSFDYTETWFRNNRWVSGIIPFTFKDFVVARMYEAPSDYGLYGFPHVNFKTGKISIAPYGETVTADFLSSYCPREAVFLRPGVYTSVDIGDAVQARYRL